MEFSSVVLGVGFEALLQGNGVGDVGDVGGHLCRFGRGFNFALCLEEAVFCPSEEGDA